MTNFNRGGRELSYGQSDVCLIKKNNRLLLPLGRYRSDERIASHNDVSRILIIFCVLFSCLVISGAVAQTQSGSVLVGEVRSAADGQAIEGASVTVDKKHARTDKQGRFTISVDKQTGVLLIKHIGYKEQRVAYENTSTTLNIALQANEKQIKEVEVVSTGYQKIPKERATGSFVQIDNKLLNRRVSTNVIERLDGVTSGMLFDKNQVGNNQAFANIRGRSTLFADPNPLVVVDNFPFQGDINSLNPNDVESITILKDAAAASIWGSKSGNGVIVIQTKSGHNNQRTKVELNSNVTLSDKPDLFYRPQLSASEYIELQQYLFDKGYYTSSLRNDYSYIPQAVDIFQKRKLGTISADQAEIQLGQLRNNEIRRDIIDNLYRTGVNQQYALSINGGNERSNYYISAGYDSNIATAQPNASTRKTLNSNWTNKYWQNRLDLLLGVSYTQANDKGTGSSYNPLSPYDRIVDANGNPLAISSGTLRADYADSVGKGVLLDWNYRPLEELDLHRTVATTKALRTNLAFTYRPATGLSIALRYQFADQESERDVEADASSFYAINLINTYTQYNRATGIIKYPIPMGGILDRSTGFNIENYGRLQANYTKRLFEGFQLDALAGVEISESKNGYNSYRYYGYNPETGVNANTMMNFVDAFPVYYNPSSSSRLPVGANEGGGVDRYLSYFSNASVAYRERYIWTVSARKDASNLFGVSSNQKGVPLWSTGLLWNLHHESFFHLGWMNRLQVKATFGYTGNVDRSVSALLTSTIGRSSSNGINGWGTYYTEILNPPNPSLRWEKIKKMNTGIVFGLWDDRIRGSVDYYYHKGIDLIGDSPIAPQVGLSKYRGNSAQVKTNGIDLDVTSRNIQYKEFSWTSHWLLNWIKDEIVRYDAAKGSNRTIVESNWSNPLVGYPQNSIFSFPWQGLDTQGMPIGVFNDEASSNYTAILNQVDASRIKYHGSGSPRYFGSWRNDFQWKSINLSFNITYKMDYYFRRRNVFNGSSYGFAQEGYSERWQQPGDELSTYIPALMYPMNTNRAAFYNNAEVLVERGDHIRLQDIQLAYDFLLRSSENKVISRMQLYGYFNNLAMLWRANKQEIDPNSISSPPVPPSWSIGFKANF